MSLPSGIDQRMPKMLVPYLISATLILSSSRVSKFMLGLEFTSSSQARRDSSKITSKPYSSNELTLKPQDENKSTVNTKFHRQFGRVV